MEIDTSISNFINIFNIGKRKIFIAGKEKKYSTLDCLKFLLFTCSYSVGFRDSY